MCVYVRAIHKAPEGRESCRGWQGALVGEIKWVENQEEEWAPWGGVHTGKGAGTNPCPSLLSQVC